MKKIFLKLVFLVTLSVAAQETATKSPEYRSVQSMLKQKEYFRAFGFIRKNWDRFSKFEKMILSAVRHNLSNSPAASNTAIILLEDRYAKQLTDSLQLELLRLKHYNHARLFEYEKARVVVKQLLANPKQLRDEAEVADFTNMLAIWTLLSGQPAQQIVILNDATIKMTGDAAGLVNLPVKSGNAASDFIFDTGANLSTVTETTAKQMGMKILGGKIEVGAITGANVNAQLAISPEFSIGTIIVKNAVFLVFPDAALAFPQIGYQINGIIGFPVIEAMGEITITRDDEFMVPKTVQPGEGHELAFDFLTPVMNIDGDAYTFDSGATGTMLYPKYFKKYRESILSNYKETDLEFGGAGGMVKKKGFVVTFNPVISGKKLQIENVQLFSEKPGDEESLFYGNIGQDVIKQFRVMTINFRYRFIRFD